jgi:hypothetical protein
MALVSYMFCAPSLIRVMLKIFEIGIYLVCNIYVELNELPKQTKF